MIIAPDVFLDYCGYYIESYNQVVYKKEGISNVVILDGFSVSKKYVLRGIHGNQDTWNFINYLSSENNILFKRDEVRYFS